MTNFLCSLCLCALLLPAGAQTTTTAPAEPEKGDAKNQSAALSYTKTVELQTRLASLSKDAETTHPDLRVAMEEWTHARDAYAKAIREHPSLATLRDQKAEILKRWISRAESAQKVPVQGPDPYLDLKKNQADMDAAIAATPELRALKEALTQTRSRYMTLRDQVLSATPEGKAVLDSIRQIKESASGSKKPGAATDSPASGKTDTPHP